MFKFKMNNKSELAQWNFYCINCRHLTPQNKYNITTRQALLRTDYNRLDTGDLLRDRSLTNVAPIIKKGNRSLILLHINDLPSCVNSIVCFFADDCLLYKEIKNKQDQLDMQRDLDGLMDWGSTWSIKFKAKK